MTSLGRAHHRVGAEFAGNLIDDALPARPILRVQTKCDERILWRTAVFEDARTLLPADGNGLMPLDGAKMVGNRGGHFTAPLWPLSSKNDLEPRGVPTLAADTQSILTSLRETVLRDVSIEG